MTDTQNFEALGRYTAAIELANKFLTQRTKALSELSMLLQGAREGSGLVIAHAFDSLKAQELLDAVKVANQNLIMAVDEANTYADACGKPKREIYPR